MAVLHTRGQLAQEEEFVHASITGSEFHCRIRGVAKVGNYSAVLPTVKGSAWITGLQQVMLDPTDPFPTGSRLSDQWHVSH